MQFCIFKTNELFQVLKDDKKRAAYDQFGAASQQPGFDPDAFANARNNPFAGAGGFGGFGGFGGGSFSSGGAAGDLFEQLFSGGLGGGGRGRTARGSDSVQGDNLRVGVKISFLDACKGAKRSINITPIANCGTCNGSGLKAGAKRTTCGSCGGSGTRTFVIDSGFHMASTCQTCGGTGSTTPRSSECSPCGGVGKVRINKTVQVDIPPGTMHFTQTLSTDI